MAGNINFALAAQPNVEPVLTPAVHDFMAAFRNGFITTDDIKRRIRQSDQEDSQLKTSLQAEDIKRRLAPGDYENALKNQAVQGQQLDLTQTLLPAQKIEAEKAARDIRDIANPVTRADALNRQRKENAELQYVQTVGELPEFFELDKPAKPLDFNTWQEEHVQKQALADADATPSGFAPNTPEDNQARAQTYNQRFAELSAGAADSYKKYVQDLQAQKEKVLRGTPEYDKELQRRLTEHVQQSVIQAAKVKALPSILESQAKPTVPKSTEVKRRTPTGEETVLIQTEPTTGAKVGETVLATNPAHLTESQANAQLFANRMAFNDKVISEIEGSQFDPTAVSTTLSKFLPNRFRSDQLQRYQAAKQNWISAVLRKESGAAISRSEYAGADKEYFPQDGDSRDVVAQKQGLRKLAEAEMHKITGAVQSGAPAAQPAPHGKQVIQDGVTFEWNGTSYVPVVE